MSSSSVISDVTQTLEELLVNGQLPKSSFDVSLKSPADETVSPSMKPKVNLFLFRVGENPFAKNQDWQPVTPDTLRYPPLALNLTYVLTPYGEDTHGHFTHYYAATWKPYLVKFISGLPPAPEIAQ